MIRVGLLDTTVPGQPGSMARYRDQLIAALHRVAADRLEVNIEYLGCRQERLDRVPPRFRMWRRHWHTWRSAKRIDRSRYDLVHLLDGSFGYAIKALKTLPSVTTVHDVIPRLQMERVFSNAPPVGHGARWLVQQSLTGVAQSTRICAVSQNTANDLQRFKCDVRADIDVVPSAVETELFAGEPLSHGDLDLPMPYLFHLGNNGFYKNRVGVVETFRHIDPDLGAMLVLAGPPPDESLRDVCRQSGLSERIVFIENPDGDQLSRYYRGAALFLFPSIYEGFGWPPLEAMAAGCPVVASNAGSLGEVVGEGGLVCDYQDHAELARHCSRLLSDPEFRQSQINAGHQWVRQFKLECMGRRMASVYRSVVGDA